MLPLKKIPSGTLCNKVIKILIHITLSLLVPWWLLGWLTYRRLTLGVLSSRKVRLGGTLKLMLKLILNLEGNFLSDRTLREIFRSYASWNASRTQTMWYAKSRSQAITKSRWSLLRVLSNVASKGNIVEFGHVILDRHAIYTKVVQLI